MLLQTAFLYLVPLEQILEIRNNSAVNFIS